MARLGSDKRPLILRVQTQGRAQEVLAVCQDHGWKAIVGIEPGKSENISDLERLLDPLPPARAEAKIGNNDPCTCGSGKKYKRCCMNNKSGEAGKEMNSSKGYLRKDKPPISRLALSRFCEELKEHPALLKKTKKKLAAKLPEVNFDDFPSGRWDSRKLREMSTEDIIAKLRSFDVMFDEDVFKKRARQYISAIRLADDHYYPRDDTDLGRDEDFIWLAVVELWKRIIPDRINVEMLDDAMQEGYSLLHKKDYPGGMREWQTAWEMIKTLIPAHIKSVDGADEFLPEPLTQSIHGWCGDFAMELYNARMYEQRIALCHEFCLRFSDSEAEIQVMLRAEAESYAELGNYDTAEKIFKALTDRFPHVIWGYVGWGDIYWLSRHSKRTSPDYDKAKSIYGMGLERCTEEADIIHERIDNLMRESGERKAFQGVRNFIRKILCKNYE